MKARSVAVPLGRSIVTVGGIAVPLAGLLLLRLVPDSTDAVETTPVPVITVPTERTILDDQAVTIRLQWQSPLPLQAPGWSGVVTAVRVAPGDELTTGMGVADVSRVRRIAARTDAPFHRPLRQGDSGADVAELHRLLVSLGYLEQAPADAEEYVFQTAQAVRALESALGIEDPAGVFDPALVVWLPVEPFRVGSVDLRVGSPAPAPGAAIAEQAQTVQRAAVEPAITGDGLRLDADAGWELLVNGATMGVHPVSREVVPDALGTLTSVVEAGAEQAAGRVRRTMPVEVLAVPSTAVMTGRRGQFCVWALSADTYEPLTVRLAGSGSGVTNIERDIPAETQILANPRDILESPTCP